MSTNLQPLALRYRPELDGLRAVAVVAVILFHLEASLLPCGFLGVDIFFVISGYLITSIILSEWEARRFSMWEFYRRRIQRILPLFFVVMVVGLILSYGLMLPEDRLSVEKSALASCAFLANILFARQGGYFDVSAEEKPFLHLWSLSVEEQFYLLFPALLLLLLRLGWRKGRIARGLLGGSLLLSLMAFVPLGRLGLDWSVYYLPHLRFGELLVGAIVALLSERASWLGLISRSQLGLVIGRIVAWSVVLISLFMPMLYLSPWFPGLLGLGFCLAVGFIIYDLEADSWVRRLLSCRLLVWLGRLSYSLYLWHWLILAFVRYIWGSSSLSAPIILAVCSLTLLLSCLTYYGVERPARAARLSFGRAFGLFYLASLLLLVAYWLYPKGGERLEEELTHYSRETICFDRLDGGCTLGDSTQEPRVLVAGDSHTGHLGRFIDLVGKAEGWSAFVTASSSCPALLDYSFSWRGQVQGFCPRRNEYLRAAVAEYPVVILANYWGSLEYHADETFVPHIISTLETLVSLGKEVYLLNTTAQMSSSRLREYYLQRRYGLSLPLEAWGQQLRDETCQKSKRYAEGIRELVAEQFPMVRWVELSDYLPSDLYHEGRPVMSNSSHLNDYGSAVLATTFLQNSQLLPPKSSH
ncbi:MAG: acyltransferase family protein [Porphyromonadaceae bacterium]|nr:acyltransferase family protein [Porphyromonadaceae bacterium]